MKLTKEQIYTLVSQNHYLPKNKFLSRCVDGRYQNSPDLPALAIPGGDAGQLAVIYSAANQYGFTVDEQKTLYTLLDVLGSKKSFSFHSDMHVDANVLGGGCGHLKQLQLDPDAYKIDKSQLETIIKVQLPCVIDYGSKQTILEGEHKEGAALQVEGAYGILPSSNIETETGKMVVQVFIYHKTLVDERHKVLAKKLIEDKAVTMYDDLDEIYLSQVLSETAESHVFETLKRLAKGLSLYNITFKDEDEFKVEEMGTI